MSDLISRSELINAVSDSLHNDSDFSSPYSKGFDDALDKVSSCIKKAKAIDAEPVKNGEWILVYHTKSFRAEDVLLTEECSICRRHEDRCITSPKNAYCPKCGAKMFTKTVEID